MSCASANVGRDIGEVLHRCENVLVAPDATEIARVGKRSIMIINLTMLRTILWSCILYFCMLPEAERRSH